MRSEERIKSVREKYFRIAQRFWTSLHRLRSFFKHWDRQRLDLIRSNMEISRHSRFPLDVKVSLTEIYMEWS